MGAENFHNVVIADTPRQAFELAVAQALYDHGHSGYSGSIAEKSSFVMIPVPPGKHHEQYAEELIDQGDPRIDDKWGPAGCIHFKTDEKGNHYYFFGWASS